MKKIKITTLWLAVSMFYLCSLYSQPIVPNIKNGNYKEGIKGNDSIIYLGGKEFKVLEGNLLTNLNLSKNLVMEIEAQKPTKNSVHWLSYNTQSNSYSKPSFSQPYDKPKWGERQYRLLGPISYIPGVGLVGSPMKDATMTMDTRRRVNKSISWIITESGELVIPKNNEFVRVFGKSKGYNFLAERTFYGFGTENNYKYIEEQQYVKEYTNGGWDLTVKNEKQTAAFLFKEYSIEKKWNELIDLKDGFYQSQYFQLDAKGYLQIGEKIDDKVLITTFHPDLTIKNTLGPALLVHTTENVWSYNVTSGMKGQISPDRLSRMILLENHELDGMFSQLKSDGSVYHPLNSLGMQPLVQETIYKTEGNISVIGKGSKDLFIVYGFIVPYLVNGKYEWRYVYSPSEAPFNFDQIDKFPGDGYENIETYFSKKLFSYQFANFYPIMVFAKEKGAAGLWKCISHKNIGKAQTLEESISIAEEQYFESAVAQHSKKVNESLAATKAYYQRLEEERLKDPAYRAMLEEKRRIASLPWSPIGGDRSERWQGFSHSAQMTALYRQNVMQSAKTWPGTTKITTTYTNGRMTGISTSRGW